MDKVKTAVEKLKMLYPDAACSLTSKTPLQLLISVRLSAQCTDLRVNLVTLELFEKYKTAEDFANAGIVDVENIIKPCGLFKTKARDIVMMCRELITRYNGIIPDTIEELLTLPGIGRKSANLIVGDVYGKPAVVADTHFIRIMNRLGFVDTKDPFKVEIQMKKLLDAAESNDFCHRTVLFGRDICKAKNPKCAECLLKNICDYTKKSLKPA